MILHSLRARRLAWRPGLTALLGGVCAGFGVVGALHAVRTDPALWLDPRGKVLYRRP